MAPEIPPLLSQHLALFERIDFLSIVSNGLFQFVFFSNRANPRLSERYDTLSLAGLKLLSQVASQADAAHVPVPSWRTSQLIFDVQFWV